MNLFPSNCFGGQYGYDKEKNAYSFFVLFFVFFTGLEGRCATRKVDKWGTWKDIAFNKTGFSEEVIKALEGKEKRFNFNLLAISRGGESGLTYISGLLPAESLVEGRKSFLNIVGVTDYATIDARFKKCKEKKFESFETELRPALLRYFGAFKELAGTLEAAGFLTAYTMPGPGTLIKVPNKKSLEMAIKRLSQLTYDNFIKGIEDIETTYSDYFHTEFLMLYDLCYDKESSKWNLEEIQDLKILSHFDMCVSCESLWNALCTMKEHEVQVGAFSKYEGSWGRKGDGLLAKSKTQERIDREKQKASQKE